MRNHFPEAAARCVSLLQRYHDGERTELARERMGLEVALVVGWLMELDPPPDVTEERVLRVVEVTLLARYGHEVGQRLNREFVEAFEECGMPLISKKRFVLLSELDEGLCRLDWSAFGYTSREGNR